MGPIKQVYLTLFGLSRERHHSLK